MLDLSVDLVRIEVPDLNPSGRFKILQTPQSGKGVMRDCKADGGDRHSIQADQLLDHIKVLCPLQNGVTVALDDVLHLVGALVAHRPS